MLNLLQQKEAVIISVKNALAHVNPFDFNQNAALEATREAIVKSEAYPGFEKFKRRVLRTYTPDHYIFKSHILLKGIVLNGEGSPASFALLNEDLSTALHLIQCEIKGISD